MVDEVEEVVHLYQKDIDKKASYLVLEQNQGISWTIFSHWAEVILSMMVLDLGKRKIRTGWSRCSLSLLHGFYIVSIVCK